MQQAEQFNQYIEYLQSHPATFIIVLLWIFGFKGVALWKAAHREEVWWFMALLVLQTFGVAEIIYLTFFTKSTEDEEQAL